MRTPAMILFQNDDFCIANDEFHVENDEFHYKTTISANPNTYSRGISERLLVIRRDSRIRLDRMTPSRDRSSPWEYDGCSPGLKHINPIQSTVCFASRRTQVVTVRGRRNALSTRSSGSLSIILVASDSCSRGRRQQIVALSTGSYMI